VKKGQNVQKKPLIGWSEQRFNHFTLSTFCNVQCSADTGAVKSHDILRFFVPRALISEHI
jgi:hypothetical protein